MMPGVMLGLGLSILILTVRYLVDREWRIARFRSDVLDIRDRALAGVPKTPDGESANLTVLTTSDMLFRYARSVSAFTFATLQRASEMVAAGLAETTGTREDELLGKYDAPLVARLMVYVFEETFTGRSYARLELRAAVQRARADAADAAERVRADRAERAARNFVIFLIHRTRQSPPAGGESVLVERAAG